MLADEVEQNILGILKPVDQLRGWSSHDCLTFIESTL